MQRTEDFLDDLFLQQGVNHPADGRHILTWEGKRYVFYLTDRHYKDLAELLAPYLDAAHNALLFRRDAVRQTTISRAERKVNADIRAWAADAGYQLSHSGPIPPEVRAAYAAQGGDLDDEEVDSDDGRVAAQS